MKTKEEIHCVKVEDTRYRGVGELLILSSPPMSSPPRRSS